MYVKTPLKLIIRGNWKKTLAKIQPICYDI